MTPPTTDGSKAGLHVTVARVIRSLPNHSGRALAIAGLLFVTMPALAAKPTAADAENYIKRGNELRRSGRDQQALPLFEKAYEVAPSPRTAAQLGLCEVVLGYWL